MTKLPPDLSVQFMSLLRKNDDGEFEVIDPMAFVTFVYAHGDQYPFLKDLVKLNEQAVIEHYEKTGEAPPGVKMTRRTVESDKVTRLEVIHGPREFKPK